jgi:histidine triad (HIT) family protein
MSCLICDILKEKKGKILFEDDEIVAMLSPAPASKGHVVVIPKEHVVIISLASDKLIKHLFNVANKISIALFEALNAEGTNIIVANGLTAGQQIAHLIIDVIPRYQNDKLNFQWQPKQLTEEEMSVVEISLRNRAKGIVFEKEVEEPIKIEEKAEAIETKKEGEEEENYLIRQLRRIP